MARSIWSGAISFGLVNVPVKLYSATEQKDVRFHQFQKDTNRRIHNKRVAEGSDDEVEYKDIVKGYEYDKDRYVVVTPEELEAVEPGRSRTIDIEDFVDLAEVDPIHFEKTYYLGPADSGGAAKPYELLRAALERSNKVAIARFVMRTKQYLAAVRASGPLLVLETMYFPDEVRPPSVVENLPEEVELSNKELDIAEQLIESLTSEWDPDRYHDTYRERVLDLIEAKAKGEEIVTEEPADEGGKVVDLMAALEASLERARGGDADGADEERSASSKRTGRSNAASGEETDTTKKTSAKQTSAKKQGSAEHGDEDLASLSKDELYEEAQRRDIPGRSGMSKDELAEALRAAS